MKKLLLLSGIVSSMIYGAETIKIVYPMESPNEINISNKLKEKAKKELDVDIEYIGVTNAELENKFLLMERTNNGADMVITQDITNMSQYLESVDDFKVDFEFNEGAVQYFSEDGKMLAIPVGTVAYGFMVNKKKVDTPEDMFGLSTSIPNGTDRHAFRNFYMYATVYGVDPLDFNDADYKKVLELYKKVSVNKEHFNTTYPDMFKAYAEGKVDFIHTGTYHIANQKPWGLESLSTSTVVAPGPYTYIGVSGIAISKNSKHKDLAKKVAKLYMDKEVISEKFLDMDLPAYNIDMDYSSLGKDEERLKREWIAVSQKGKILPKIKNQGKVEKMFKDNIILFIEGKIDADTVIKNLRNNITNN
ncbi:MAG: ABC transporter substrate-binding protein [Fusobacteriaceae bacterium]